MRSDKRKRAMQVFNGHHGPFTVAHVEHLIQSEYPSARDQLTGFQYGLVMSVCNRAFHDGRDFERKEIETTN